MALQNILERDVHAWLADLRYNGQTRDTGSARSQAARIRGVCNLRLNCPFRWSVYDIGDPYLLYRIKVTVEQLAYTQSEAGGEQVWNTIGEVTVGPERIGNFVDSEDISAPRVRIYI